MVDYLLPLAASERVPKNGSVYGLSRDSLAVGCKGNATDLVGMSVTWEPILARSRIPKQNAPPGAGLACTKKASQS